jgi:propanol-preferring alcohol dehydrogenase
MMDLPVPEPGPGEVLIRVELCGVCRTDLHVVEGDLPAHKEHVVPGHEVVGWVECRGPSGPGEFRPPSGWGELRLQVGQRVGVAWLHETCGVCPYCARSAENLCDAPRFTGYDVDGGYAEYLVAPEAFVYPLPDALPSAVAAPMLCAGIIGYRALRRSGVRDGEPIGLYGFGSSAHIVLQIARHRGCEVFVCTRGAKHRDLARRMGAAWVGPADAAPPVKLRGGILFAPAGELVPAALSHLDKGGNLACAGIYMTPIPELDYGKYLFQERSLRSVTANTRRDGRELLKLAAEIPLTAHTEEFPLGAANAVLDLLKNDGVNGTALLRVSPPPATERA